MENKPQAVIFDMDGVILDSERVLLEGWKELAKEVPMPGIEEAYIRVCGTTMEATEQTMKEIYGADFPFEDMENRAIAIRDRLYPAGIPLKPGVRELLNLLREHQIPIALATSTAGDLARGKLETAGLWHYFDAAVTGEMVQHSKPDPEIFLLAMQQLGSDPKMSVIIEDSFNGIRAGHAAGAQVIMVPDLQQPDTEIFLLCDRIFPSLHEVRDYFLNI